MMTYSEVLKDLHMLRGEMLHSDYADSLDVAIDCLEQTYKFAVKLAIQSKFSEFLQDSPEVLEVKDFMYDKLIQMMRNLGPGIDIIEPKEGLREAARQLEGLE